MLLTRENLVLIILITLCILLWFIRSYIETFIYTTTPNYLQTEQRIKELHDENMKLEDQLLYSESYTYIASEAAKMGLTQKASPIYLH